MSVTVMFRACAAKGRLVDAPTKTGDRRNVRLDGATVALFRSQHALRGDVSDDVFSRTEGPPNPDRISWWWLHARDRAGIELASREVV